MEVQSVRSVIFELVNDDVLEYSVMDMLVGLIVCAALFQ